MSELVVDLRPARPSDWDQMERIVRRWPKHFVGSGIEVMRKDFEEGDCVVATIGERVVGFQIWRDDGQLPELLWLAVEPTLARRGIGTRLVAAAREAVGTDRPVLVKTATLDSMIDGTEFDGKAFAGTHRFLGRLGFTSPRLLREEWGPKNHALALVLKPNRA